MLTEIDFRASTRRGGASVSYKEDSADETGSEDLVEVDWEAEVAVPQEPDNAETIEKILDSRMGRKGGTYCVTRIAMTTYADNFSYT